jgi:hypothetical protein
MDELDDLDIELRDLDDIGCRIVLLTALAMWPDHDELEDRDSWADWLHAEGVATAMTRAEQTVIDAHRERELVESDLDVCGRAMDALQALTWAVAMIDELQLTLSEDTAAGFIEGIPIPGERVEQFLDGLVLREEDTIAVERERAEVWNWRLAAEVSYRRGSARVRQELSHAIKEVILECASTMVIAETDGNDFLIDGVAVRDLDDDAINTILVASEEHLRALNWLCGLTDWEAIHLPD